MPTARKTALRLTALAAGAATSWYAAVWLVERLEDRNAERVTTALAAAEIDWAQVETTGLQARLSGIAPDEVARFRALKAAGTAVNPANLVDMMAVAPPADLPPPAFRLELLRTGDEIKAVGLIPGTAATARELERRIARIDATNELAVAALVKTSPEPAPSAWEAALAPALAALGSLDPARVVMTPGALTVEGRATDGTTADRLEGSLRQTAPPSLTLELQIDRPRPVVSPFVLRADITETGGRLETCMARDAAGLAALKDAVTAVGLTGRPDCSLAIGAPTEDWEAVAAAAIKALGAAGGGRLTVSDLSVRMAMAPGTAADAAGLATFGRNLPDAYSFSLTRPRAATATGDGEALPPPVFTATLSPEGLAQLRGAVGGPDDRTLLESYATARFSGMPPHLSLEPRPTLPDGWQLRVLAGLEALGSLDSGRLEVDASRVVLVGATGDPALRLRLSAALSETLGPGSEVELDVRVDPALSASAGVPMPETCLADIRAIQAREKITFAPGSTELDSTALGIVAQIAEVLRGCDRLEIRVSGHTDSQGRAEMNAELSRERAEAVVAALVAEKILPATLEATGYGETRPVADNDTEAGREANRRIDFSLRRPLFGPIRPPPAAAEPANRQAAEADGDGAD